jgi:PAS domain S-box-containing protein
MQNKRILVVEDEIITAMDIQSNLEKLDYQVVDVVLDGKRAIKVAQALNPDLILMDIVLKGELDGIEAANVISKKCDIPIIFLTAYKDNKTFNRAKLCLPYDYLTKPFEPRDLQIAIELAMYKHDIQSKLTVSENRNKLLMENASCGIFIHDRFGMISDINKQGTIIFGDTKAAILGQDFRKFLPVTEQEYAQILLNKLVLEKKIGPYEWHIIQPNGNTVDVQFSAVCMDLGKEEILMSVLTDITKQNKLREQTVLNDKLVSMGTLTAGIIHEINNPLNWVLNNLTFLKDKFNNVNITDNFNNFNRAIDDALIGALSIHHIASSLKGFARADETELINVDINQLIEKILHMLTAETKFIQVEKNLDESIPNILTCDYFIKKRNYFYQYSGHRGWHFIR